MRTAISPIHSFTLRDQGAPTTGLAAMPLDDLADPDYDHHPAYGLAFPPARLGTRLRALARFTPWLFFAVVKQTLLGDRIPGLPREADGLEGGLRRRLEVLPRYVPAVLAIIAGHLRRTFARPAPIQADAKLAETLRRDGILVSRLGREELDALRGQLSGELDKLLDRRRRATATSFKGNQRSFTRRQDHELFASVTGILERNGLMAAAGVYLDRPVAISRMVLQVNDARDRYLYSSFQDVGLANSRTNYMHIDRAHGCLKCVLYLSEVGERNGPFSFVLGSNRVKFGALGGIVRRAVDRAGLAECDRETRRLFMALPRGLRKKAEFGSDLLDGSANSDRLLNAEFHFTSASGDIAVFDNLGIHRGALVAEGQRRAMFITLA